MKPTNHKTDMPGVLRWVMTYLHSPVDVTVEGPSGILIEGPAIIRGVTDCLPGEDPTVCWLELARPDLAPWRLWLWGRQFKSAELDEADATLTISMVGGESYKLHPLAPYP